MRSFLIFHWILLINLFIETNCAQELNLRDGCWLPQKYVDAAKNLDLIDSLTVKSYSIPISALCVEKTNIGVELFASEMTKVKLEPTADLNKYKLTGLLRPAGNTMLPYIDSKYYLSKFQDKLLVEVVTDTRTDSIFLVDNFDGIPLRDPWESTIKFCMIGARDVYDSFGKHIRSNVEIRFDESILNWPEYSKFKIDETVITDWNKQKAFDLISLKNSSNDSLEYLALDIDNSDLTLFLYEYTKKPKEWGVVTGKLKYILKKHKK